MVVVVWLLWSVMLWRFAVVAASLLRLLVVVCAAAWCGGCCCDKMKVSRCAVHCWSSWIVLSATVLMVLLLNFCLARLLCCWLLLVLVACDVRL